jgi:hypothetical protein
VHSSRLCGPGKLGRVRWSLFYGMAFGPKEGSFTASGERDFANGVELSGHMKSRLGNLA